LHNNINVSNIQRYSIHDGPGIRSTIFLKGCPLKCSWCANPESQSMNNELMYDSNLCIRCKKCVSACLYNAIIYNQNNIKLLRDNCIVCGACVNVCPTKALELAATKMTYKDVFKEVIKDKIFYDKSNGGVTISGGEPSLHMEFLNYISKACRERNIHIAIETCGYCEWDSMNKIGELFDFIYYDIKQINEKKHIKFTTKSNKIILSNLRKLLNKYHSKTDIVLRYPLIPGCNDSKGDLDNLIYFLKSLDHIVKIEILPYHRLGISKYQKLGRKYYLNDIKPPDNKKIEDVEFYLKNKGINPYIIK